MEAPPVELRQTTRPQRRGVKGHEHGELLVLFPVRSRCHVRWHSWRNTMSSRGRRGLQTTGTHWRFTEAWEGWDCGALWVFYLRGPTHLSELHTCMFTRKFVGKIKYVKRRRKELLIKRQNQWWWWWWWWWRNSWHRLGCRRFLFLLNYFILSLFQKK